MKVVVDTNIIFSAILNSQSRIGQILLQPGEKFRFYSPRFLQVEIQNHITRIKQITKLNDTEVNELIGILYSKIHFVAEEIIPKEVLVFADHLTEDVDFDDIMFIALSVYLKCKLWTGDKDLMTSLKRKGYNRFISTQEMLKKLR